MSLHLNLWIVDVKEKYNLFEKEVESGAELSSLQKEAYEVLEHGMGPMFRSCSVPFHRLLEAAKQSR